MGLGQILDRLFHVGPRRVLRQNGADDDFRIGVGGRGARWPIGAPGTAIRRRTVASAQSPASFDGPPMLGPHRGKKPFEDDLNPRIRIHSVIVSIVSSGICFNVLHRAVSPLLRWSVSRIIAFSTIV